MAKIIETRDICLDDLVIGQAQVRTQNPGKDISDLAESIRVQGLLQPIVVCPARDEGKWEILTGQRRFLAHRELGLEKIPASVLDERVDAARAKAISITENLLRRNLSGLELVDGIGYLYGIYESTKVVSEKTGIPQNKVRNYVKYPRLIQPLKEMYDRREIDLSAALKAQDLSTNEDEEVDKEKALRLAKEMQPLTDSQRRSVVKNLSDKPSGSIDDEIEAVKTAKDQRQVIVTLGTVVRQGVGKFARAENLTQDEASGILIEEALIARGILDE